MQRVGPTLLRMSIPKQRRPYRRRLLSPTQAASISFRAAVSLCAAQMAGFAIGSADGSADVVLEAMEQTVTDMRTSSMAR